jgi:hypothetical protein
MENPPDDLDALVAPHVHLESFVLRFVFDETGKGGWHGVLRHIQSDAELHFTRWDEATAFISRYVPLSHDESLARH